MGVPRSRRGRAHSDRRRTRPAIGVPRWRGAESGRRRLAGAPVIQQAVQHVDGAEGHHRCRARLNDDGVEGLIHISELADRRVNHPKEVVSENEEYDLRIIRIDTDKRRMGLSLKQALPKEEIDWQIAPSAAGSEESLDDEIVDNEELVPVMA